MAGTILVFFADEDQCAEWDIQLLGEHQNLATIAEKWRSPPGWYWSELEDDTEDITPPEGPFSTRAECECDAREQRQCDDCALLIIEGDPASPKAIQ